MRKPKKWEVLAVALDKESKAKLARNATFYGKSMSAVVRELIHRDDLEVRKLQSLLVDAEAD